MHGEHHHVCTKCGWTFPNSHPSAKHRRSHKKVCGKLEGFKILESKNSSTHLPGSDDDDEDHNKEEASNNNVKGAMGRQISNRSEGEEFSDANNEFFYTGVSSTIVGATENPSLIQPSNNPTDGNQLQSPQALENVEEQMEADTNQDHDASSSTMHSVVGSVSDQVAASLTAETIEATNGSKPKAAANENPENIQNGENTVDSRQVEDTTRESNIDGSKSAPEALTAKTASDSPGDNTILISGARPAEGVLDSKEETVALGLKDPQDEISPGTEDGCSVNESLPAALDHSSVDVDRLSKTATNDFKEQELEKTEPNLMPDTCKAINETEVHLKNSEQTHSDFLVSKSGGTADISPSAVEILEDNLEPEEMGSKIIVEGQADTSAAKDRVSENFESNGVETFLDTRTSFSHKLQELDCSQQEKTHEILPETQSVVGADGDATISPPDSFSEKTDEVKVNVATEESRIENSDITSSYIGAIEENSTKATGDCFEVASFLSEPEKSLKETESTSDNQTELSGMDINENHLANTTQSLSNAQVCRDESFQQHSEEPEIISNIALPSIKKTEVNTVDTNSIIADPVHEGTKLNNSSEVGFIQSGAENPIINDFMPSAVDPESCILSPGKVEENKGKDENPIINDFMPYAVDAESCILSPGKVEENKGKDFPGDASDVHSQALQEKGESNILEHKSDASSAMPRDWSIDTISQTDDSVEGIWGSVSDGAGPSVKGPNDVPPILAAEVLPGTDTPEPKEATQTAPLVKTLDALEEQNFGNNHIFDSPSFMTLVESDKGEGQQSASSEIRTAQNPEQSNSSSLQAGWFPSHAHAINESEGRKKNEEIIEKVTKWSSDKEHIPLRSLLVEANVESKHKVKSTQSHYQETDTSTSTQDAAVLQAKTVDPPTAATPEATTTHTERDAEKEWNSPARLPISREKRKVRYWAPFLCCSSVN